MSEAIRTDALTKRYRGVRALDGVSLQIPQGAIYALVGPNGAGKTTLIKILMNLIPASSGHAKVLGSDQAKSTVEPTSRSAMFPRIRRFRSGCERANSWNFCANSILLGTQP